MMRIFRAIGQAGVVLAVGALMMAASATNALAQGEVLYVPLSQGSPLLGEFGVSSSTGALTPFPSTTTNNTPFIVVVAPNNKFLYVGGLGGLIDQFTVAPNGTLS